MLSLTVLGLVVVMRAGRKHVGESAEAKLRPCVDGGEEGGRGGGDECRASLSRIDNVGGSTAL
jgi:hypothetical protein